MAGSENTTALPQKGEPASPVYELGRLLGAVIAEGRRADDDRVAGVAHPAAADAREYATDAAREAIERLILATKAGSLPDAAVHALLLRELAADLEVAVADGNDHSTQRALWTIERLARSIFDVLARETGIAETQLSADYYLSDAALLWPSVAGGDLSGIGELGGAFADAIAAFDAAADAPLCIPQAPTSAMMEAGAVAAGISPEQFSSAYAAAVDAYRKERAA